MKIRKIFIQISTKHDFYYRIVLIAISIIAIASFLPNELRFNYEFEKGRTWQYDDLKAPFDFAILKSPEILEEERNLLLTNVQNYFRVDSIIPLKTKRDFEQRAIKLNSKDFAIGKKIISTIYQNGIVELPRNSKILNTESILLIKGAIVEEYSLNSFFQRNSLVEFTNKELVNSSADDKQELNTILLEVLSPNIFYDAALTEKVKNSALENLSLTRGVIQQGKFIINRGKIITSRDFEILQSLQIAFEEQQPLQRIRYQVFIGYLLLVSAAMIVLLSFLWLLRKDILLDTRKVTLLFLLIVFFTLLYTFIQKHHFINLLIVPLCILPLVTRAFFDTRTALFTHVLTMLVIGIVAPNGLEFVFMQMIAGMVAIFSIVNMRSRSQLFVSIGFIFLAYMVTYIGLAVISEGNFKDINYVNCAWLGANVLLTLLTYPLIFLIERSFRVTSDFSLIELTDFNSELLRELSTKAPGTFQHSLQVANLAEAAIFKIGGNSLLVRVGALYHDIGKIEMPMYFIENQSTQINPHDELSFDESASIIISHVIRGIEKAKKFGLPDPVIDFIRTHHGTMMVQYFYQSFLKNYPDKVPNEDDFRYPGPKPFSKETAVLMMADSVEAAARSLTVHDSVAIDKLVEDIIHHQQDCGQFENCDITYRDIASIKRIFKKMLNSIYHVRLQYPGAG